MSDQSPRQNSAIWVMLLAMVMAWLAGGVYRWQVPPFAEVRAKVQVPAATDLETLCQRPDLRPAAVQTLEADTEIFLPPTASGVYSPVSGLIQARKIPSGTIRAVTSRAVTSRAITSRASDAPAELPEQAGRSDIETWEISYQSRQPGRSLAELGAIMDVLKKRISTSMERDDATIRRDRSAARIDELEDQLLDAELQLETVSEGADNDVAPMDPRAWQQRVESVQQQLIEARNERERREADWKLAEDEFLASQQLATAMAKLQPGAVRDLVRGLEQKQKLSAELARLNQMEARFSDIYGDKHPKLLDVRTRFQQVLTALGGWDEVIDQGHLAEQLETMVAAAITEQAEVEADLTLQLELEQEKLAETVQTAQRCSQLTSRESALKDELAAAHQTLEATSALLGPTFVVIQPPTAVHRSWYWQLGLLFGLATLCGLIAGKVIHRTWFAPLSITEPESESEPPFLPSFQAISASPMDLAQRRAVRQARLKQAYA